MRRKARRMLFIIVHSLDLLVRVEVAKRDSLSLSVTSLPPYASPLPGGELHI